MWRSAGDDFCRCAKTEGRFTQNLHRHVRKSGGKRAPSGGQRSGKLEAEECRSYVQLNYN